MTITQIKAEIQAKLEKNQRSHYNHPSLQRLVDKETNALQVAITALELFIKTRTKTANEWVRLNYPNP